MIAAYKKKSNFAALAFVCGITALFIVQQLSFDDRVPALGSVLAWVSGTALICSCWFYLKAKGRSGWWMLLLIIMIFGLIGFALLKDLAKEGVRNPEQPLRNRGGWSVRAGIVGVGLLTIGIAINVVMAMLGSRVARDMEQACIPLIAALESYRTAHRIYPEKLAELVPVYIVDLPRCNRGAINPVNYYRGDDGEYKLTCYTYFVQKHSYASQTRKWYNWD